MERPSRWLRSALVAGSLLSGPEASPHEHITATAAAEIETEQPTAKPDAFPRAHERRAGLDTVIITTPDGRQETRATYRARLDQEVNAALRKPELLGALADRCAGAEQCYYYFGDQLTSNEPLISLATGKPLAELRFTAQVLRGGLVKKVGFAAGPGAILGVTTVGEHHIRHLPPPEKQTIVERLYDQAVLTVEEQILREHLITHPPNERAVLADNLQAIVNAQTELETYQARVEQARQKPEYNRGFLSTAPQKLITHQTTLSAAQQTYETTLTKFAEAKTLATADTHRNP